MPSVYKLQLVMGKLRGEINGNLFTLLFIYAVLGVKSRALCVLGKQLCCLLHPGPSGKLFLNHSSASSWQCDLSRLHNLCLSIQICEKEIGHSSHLAEILRRVNELILLCQMLRRVASMESVVSQCWRCWKQMAHSMGWSKTRLSHEVSNLRENGAIDQEKVRGKGWGFFLLFFLFSMWLLGFDGRNRRISASLTCLVSEEYILVLSPATH